RTGGRARPGARRKARSRTGAGAGSRPLRERKLVAQGCRVPSEGWWMTALLGIDEGTSAVKAVLYDADLHPLAEARREKSLSHPRPGWVEQNPDDVLVAVVGAIAEVLEEAPGQVTACGLDHQGESVLAWDAESGRPL